MINPLLILNYHDFAPLSPYSRPDQYALSQHQFIQQLDTIANYKIPIITTTNWRNNSQQSGLSVALTFDDGYASHFNFVLPLLNDRGIVASFFPTVSNISNPNFMDWQQLKRLSTSGHDVGSHGFHHDRLINLATSELVDQVSDSKQQLSHQLNQPIDAFALPFGVYTKKTLKALTSQNFVAIHTTLGLINLHKKSTLLHRFNMTSQLDSKHFEQLLALDTITLHKHKWLSRCAFISNRLKGYGNLLSSTN